MRTFSQDVRDNTDNVSEQELYVVLCASGFENEDRVRSALMFSSLAASANYRTIPYCIQNAVDVIVRGALERCERAKTGLPTIGQRLREAIEMGVEIQCCTQTMANRRITADDLIEGVKPAGAMTLIDLSTRAKGTLSF